MYPRFLFQQQHTRTVLLTARLSDHLKILRVPARRRSRRVRIKQVAFLRRQQKLRKVVVSALRRQSYAWHVNDASRAIRKWKEFVRRGRDDDRLSLELSRISAVSPMTPLETRVHASALGSYSVLGRGTLSGSRGYGGGGGGAGGGDVTTPSFYRSLFSPAISNSGKSSTTRRRLWSDQE